MTLFGPPNIVKLKEKKKIKALIKALSYRKDDAVRRDAVTALGELEAGEAASHLIDILSGEDRKSLAVEAAAALARIGDPIAVSPLVEALKTSTALDRGAIQEALKAFPIDAVVASLIAMGTNDPTRRRLAIQTLVVLESARVLQPLAVKDHPWRRETLDVLQNEGKQSPVLTPLLIRTLQRARDQLRPPQVYEGLLELAVAIGEPAAAPLADLLDRGDLEFQKYVLGSLGKIGGPAAVRAFMKTAESEVPDLRSFALARLSESKCPEASEAILKAFDDPETSVRETAVFAAGVLQNPNLAGPMSRFLEGDGDPLGLLALMSIARIGGEDSARLFVTALEQPRFKYRKEAAGFLKGLRVKEPGKLFHPFVNDPDPEVRRIALDSLDGLPPDAARRALEAALMDENRAVGLTAAGALSRLNLKPVSEEAKVRLCLDTLSVDSLGRPSSDDIPVYIRLLDDKYLFPKVAAILAQLDWDPPPDHPQTARFLLETNRIDRCVRAGNAVISGLIEHMRTKSGSECEKAVRFLAACGDPAAVPAICERIESMRGGYLSLEGRERALWQTLLEALARFPDPRGTAFLNDLIAQFVRDLGSRFIKHRKCAAETLVKLFLSGAVDDRVRPGILAARELIQSAHTDYGTERSHSDGMRLEEAWCQRHEDIPASIHKDVGIGVHFPPGGPLYRDIEQPVSLNDLRIPIATLASRLQQTEDEADRIQALKILAASTDRAARGLILSALKDSAWPVRAAAVRGIGSSLKTEAAPLLMERLEDESWQVRQEALMTVQRLKLLPEGPTQELLIRKALLESPDPEARRAAAGELAACGVAEAVNPLITALDDPEPSVRVEAARALGILGNTEAIPHLEKALGDANLKVRESAMEALARIGAPPSEALLKDPVYLALSRDWSACVALGSEAVDPLSAMLDTEDPLLRGEVMRTLEAIVKSLPPDFALEILKSDPHAGMRAAAAEALAGHEGNRFINALRRALQADPEPVVRAAAAEALGKAEPHHEMDNLLRLLSAERDFQALGAILENLKAPNPTQAVGLLLNVHSVAEDVKNDLGRLDSFALKPALQAKDRGIGLLRGVAIAASELLQSVWGPDREKAAEKLRSGFDSIQTAVVEAFRKMGEFGFSELEKLIDNSSDIPRVLAAIRVIAAIPDDTADRVLARAFCRDALRHGAAMEDLISGRGPRMIAHLTPLLSPQMPEAVRNSALRALERLRWSPRTTGEKIQVAVLKKDWDACRRMGGEAVPCLADVLRQGPSSREEAEGIVSTLVGLGGEAAGSALCEAVSGSSYHATRAAIRVLPGLGSEKALRALLPIIGAPDHSFRSSALEALKALYQIAPGALRNYIHTLAEGNLRHVDTAARNHQDSKVRHSNHKDYGGGKCIYPHTDIGSVHTDLPGSNHQDSGIGRDFPL